MITNLINKGQLPQDILISRSPLSVDLSHDVWRQVHFNLWIIWFWWNKRIGGQHWNCIVALCYPGVDKRIGSGTRGSQSVRKWDIRSQDIGFMKRNMCGYRRNYFIARSLCHDPQMLTTIIVRHTAVHLLRSCWPSLFGIVLITTVNYVGLFVGHVFNFSHFHFTVD